MTATPEAIELARTAARAADEKLAHEIVALDVSEHLAVTDVFLIASAPNERQVGAVVDAVMEACHREGVKPRRREGERGNRWVLIDFGDIVLHAQHQEDREFYDLERLWKDCPRIDLQLPEHPEGRQEAASEAASQERPWWLPAEDVAEVDAEASGESAQH